MAGKPILETERLVLHEFDEDDVEPFYLMGSDPEVIRYTGDPAGGLANREQALESLRARPLADYQKYGYGRWACVLKSSGVVIGFAGLKFLPESREIDLGYRLLRPYWGNGYASEAARAVLDYGLTQLGLERIIGLVHPENVASVRILEKLGMKLVERVEFEGRSFVKYVIERAAKV